MAFNLYLVRHGQTYLNKYGRMQGWTDAPLTESGLSDADAAGTRLANVHFDAAYSSDLSRARITAEHILEANQKSGDLFKPTEIWNFREVFFGSYEGLRSDVIAPEIAEKKGLPNGQINTYSDLVAELGADGTMDACREFDAFEDAEDSAMFWKRFDAGMDQLRANHTDGENVLVVAHGTVVRNVAARFADEATAKVAPENGMVSVWTVSEDDLTMEAYNDTTTIW